MSVSLEVQNVSTTTPYYRNMDLNQLFAACLAKIALIHQTPEADSDSELVRRRLDKVSLTYESVSTDFWSYGYSPDPVMYLLLLMLHKVYDSLIQYVDNEHLIVSTELSEGIPASDSLLLQLAPRRQVCETLQTLLSGLEVFEDERERIEEYVYRVNLRIGRASKSHVQLDKLITVLEMWADHFAGLVMYTYARSSNGSTTSVKFALTEITCLLSLKELKY
jgi:hypothetical protein